MGEALSQNAKAIGEKAGVLAQVGRCRRAGRAGRWPFPCKRTPAAALISAAEAPHQICPLCGGNLAIPRVPAEAREGRCYN